MESLIRTQPREALAQTISLEEWAKLPDEIKREVEKPFSAACDYTFYPICGETDANGGGPEPEFYASIITPEGSELMAFTYGRRSGMPSKRKLPVQGIALSGLAAMRDGPLQVLEPSEVEVAAQLFPDALTGFSEGRLARGRSGKAAVYALAGGRIITFGDLDEALELDARLAELDQRPGPFAASSLLADSTHLAADGSFDLKGAETKAVSAASAWTETKKRLLLIRINFPDKPEKPVTKAAADTEMGKANERIREMSYGKTWMEFTTSVNIYTMPQTFEYYRNPDSRLWGELLRDARNTFRTRKSGADATCDIGPVSDLPGGAGGGLGDYDIVGIFRTSLPGEGGVAGGADLYMMANHERIYTHEWGHNYGVHHASHWKTTDGSVAGAGENIEYGDPFDVMGTGPVPEGHFHAEGKVRLNWLEPTRWKSLTPTDSGLYRIYRIDDPNAPETLNALRIPRGGNGASYGYYWVGHRGAYATNPHLSRGSYLIWQRPSPDDYRSWLLDNTPESPAGTQDSALALGRTFSDPDGHAFITTVGAGGAGAESYIDVQVNLGPFPENIPPAAAAVTGPAIIKARTTGAYSISATDANGDPLTWAWDMGDGMFRETPNKPSLMARWVVGGTYPLSVDVSDMKGGSVTKTMEVTVDDPLDLWTVVNVGRPVDIVEVEAGNCAVLGLGSRGEIFHSWDGISWAEVSHQTGIEYGGRLCFGNGLFVFSGKGGGDAAPRIAWSADGRIWENAQRPGVEFNVSAVSYGGGKFLALGNAGNLLWSRDGKEWNHAGVSGSPDFLRLAWNGSLWLATARNPINGWGDEIWSSEDGITWARNGVIGVDGDQLVAYRGVFHFMSWWSGIRYSTDNGKTWKESLFPKNAKYSARHSTIAPDGTMVAIGIAQNESGAPRVPLISIDGVEWHPAVSGEFKTAVSEANDLCFAGGRLISASRAGAVYYSRPLFPNAAPVISRSSFKGAMDARGVLRFSAGASDPERKPLRYFWDFGPGYPVVEGADVEIVPPFGGPLEAVLRVIDPSGGIASANHSIDLRDPVLNFTNRTSGATSDLVSVAANESVAVAVGDANNPVLTSTDGANWTRRTLPEWTYVHDIAWDGGKFILVGHAFGNSSWNNVIYTSPDGVDWTRRYSAVAGEDLVSVVAAAPGAGALVCGKNGHCLRSADGLTWSQITVPALGSLDVTDIAAGPSGYVMLANSFSPTSVGKVFSSRDGMTWVDRSGGTGLEASWKVFERVSWLNDRHVASGWNTGIRTSTDGGRSFSQARKAGNFEIRAMAYGGGVHYCAGRDLDKSLADADVVSLNGIDWHSLAPDTSNDRLGAVFFKDTFITVGQAGEIRQSDPIRSVSPFPILKTVKPVLWDGVKSELQLDFLGLPGQNLQMEYSNTLAGPWKSAGRVETGGLGLLQAFITEDGDKRQTWGKRMFFRFRK